MRRVVLGVIAALSATGTAHAQGVRAEVHAGVDSIDGISPSSADVFGGIGLGYDYSINKKIFVGIEANLDESNVSESIPLTPSGGTFSFGFGRDINVNARIGTTIGESGKTKIYALAGYSNLRLSLATTATATSPATKISGNGDGFRAGVGIEHDISNRIYAKVEYRYSNYDGGLSRNQGLAGIGIRF